MKRLAASCVIIFLCFLIAGLSQTAIDSEDFTGQWYSSTDQNVYLFQEGIIYCSKHAVILSDTISISGAYSFSRNSIFMFTKGIAGLETEKELYLVRRGDESFLCENEDGTGAVYFIRYSK